MTKKVFISYRSTEGLAADALISIIRDSGDYDVWYDQQLEGGQKWWDEIIKNIKSADIIILALSNAYLDSEPCRLEREYAQQLGKAIIPIQIDPDLDFARLDTEMKSTQIVRYHPYARDKERLEQALANAQSAALPSELPEPPSAPIEESKSNNRIMIIMAFIAVFVIITAIITILPSILGNPTPSDTIQTNSVDNTVFPTIEALSGDFDITLIYGASDSFTIRANAESYLFGLTFTSDIGSENPENSFPALAATGYKVEAGTCLQYIRSGQTPPRARGCSDNLSFTIELLDADLFWYDTGTNQAQDLVLRQDGELISLCSSASRQCDLSAP